MKSPDDSPYESLAFVPEWKTKRLSIDGPSNAVSRRRGHAKSKIISTGNFDPKRADAKLRKF